jgi:hypothetical protein
METLAMQEDNGSEVRDAVMIAGGIALVVLGTGFILAHPGIRRLLLSGTGPLGPVGERISGVLPDVERYLKLKAM